MAQQGNFIHTVLFWTNSAEDAQKLIAGCSEHLPKVPSVLRISVGTPAGTQRDVVDNSYGVLLLTEFADAAGHDIYADHPDHLAFIAACKHLWTRVQVYDALVSA